MAPQADRPMRVLWFVNASLGPVAEHLGHRFTGSGWWLVALARELVRRHGLDLTVANIDAAYSHRDSFTDPEGVTYELIPGRQTRLSGAGLARNIALARDAVRRCDPGLVEVHGTERFYGLASPVLDRPVLVNIQGLLNAVVRHPWGRYSLGQVLVRTVRSIGDVKWAAAAALKHSGLRRRAAAERRVFAVNRYFTGRTAWDEHMARKLSPGLRAYYACPRMLREPFFHADWTPQRAEAGRLFTCARPEPYKGLDDLVRMLAVLRGRYPDVHLRIAGGATRHGWSGYLLRLAHRLGVADRVQSVDYLSADRIAEELSQAAIYVHPSYVDNSPNTLAEAMCVGTPSVATRVGGIPSLVEDGRTGLLCRAGDVGQLGERVGRLLDDAELAMRIGRKARETARRRHDPGAVAARAMEIYRAVMEARPRV